MSAQATEPITPRPAAAVHLQPSSQEVDASCRFPVLLLATCSVLWLIFALAAQVLASVKSHAPGMMADTAALTFGRIAGASSSAFYYGFASQAAIAISIWLFARMGRTLMVLPRVSIIAALVWNVGVLLGIGGIFAGEMTHYPAFEMPAAVVPVLFAAFALLGIAAILTFHARTEREVYPAGWFLFAALFVFPWIYSAAGLLLGGGNIRGVLQPVISTWFFNNFVMLWLGSVALGVIFYFVSKLSGQPLHSSALAVFGFWFYILFAHGSGFQNIAGLPNWMPATSRVVNMLLFVPALAIVINWWNTWKGPNRQKKQPDPAAGYIVFAAAAFPLSLILLGLVSAFDEVLGFSLFVPGMIEWIIYGFITMAFFGALSYMLPRLTDVEWPKDGLTRWHFRLSAAGIILSVGALLFGGFVHGTAMNNPSIPMLTAVRRAVPFIGVSTIGLLLFLAAQVLLLINMVSMFRLCWAECCGWGSRKEATR